MKKNIAIIIPIYKPFQNLSQQECDSLKQCLTILFNRKIFLCGPKGFNIIDYVEFAKKFNYDDLQIIEFDNLFFQNIEGYNKLLLSEKFYQTFNQYRYILIYQLDGWVFRDELDKWCNLEYDFVGAPLFERGTKNTNLNFSKGLNGGVSLRKISSSIHILQKINTCKTFYLKTKSIFKHHRISYFIFKLLFKNIKIKSFKSFEYLLINTPNEDIVWTVIIPKVFNYPVPSSKKCIPFCFEMHPSYLFELNNYKLPFACHAWEKHEPSFWEKFIVKNY